MAKYIYVLAQPNYFTEGDRGRVTHALGVVDGLTKNGVDVTVITGQGFDQFVPRFSAEQIAKINYRSIGSEGNWYKQMLATIEDEIKQSRSDIAGLIVRYKAGKLLFLNRVARLCKRSGIPSTIEVNSFYFSYNSNSLKSKVLSSIVKPIELKTVFNYDVIYVISNPLRKILEQNNCPSQIVVLPNGATPREENRDYVESPLRLVYTGKLMEYYEIAPIIKAILSDRNKNRLRFDIYGYGPQEAELRAMAQDSSLVTFHGEYDNQKLDRIIMSPNDVLILPFIHDAKAVFASPLKLYEYMALKSPIISSNTGQATEIIQDRKNGFFFSKPDEIFDIVNKHLCTEKQRREIAETAYLDLMTNHTWEQRFKHYLSKVSK